MGSIGRTYKSLDRSTPAVPICERTQGVCFLRRLHATRLRLVETYQTKYLTNADYNRGIYIMVATKQANPLRRVSESFVVVSDQ